MEGRGRRPSAPDSPEDRRGELEQAEDEQSGERPHQPAVRRAVPERQLRVDVAVDLAVGGDVVGALGRDLHHPNPDVRVVVDGGRGAPAFGDLRIRYPFGRNDGQPQRRYRQAAAARTADGLGVEADRRLPGRQMQAARSRDRHLAVGVVLVQDEGVEHQRHDESDDSNHQGQNRRDHENPRRRSSASHPRSLSRLALRRCANQPGDQPGPQAVDEPLLFVMVRLSIDKE